jgi:hypothetical protein
MLVLGDFFRVVLQVEGKTVPGHVSPVFVNSAALELSRFQFVWDAGQGYDGFLSSLPSRLAVRKG